MSVLGIYLRKRGYRVINIGYASRKYGLEDHVLRVHSILSREVPSATPLFFVTHSLGSIILRRFAHLHHPEFNLQRAVMLGPPNQGSQTARAVLKIPVVRAILGPPLKELATLQLDAASDKLEIGIIAGGRGSERGMLPHLREDNDGIVTVKETTLDGAKDHLVLPGLHSFLMYQPTVLFQIKHFLEEGNFLRHGNS
jgi:hypothetical protein